MGRWIIWNIERSVQSDLLRRSHRALTASFQCRYEENIIKIYYSIYSRVQLSRFLSAACMHQPSLGRPADVTATTSSSSGRNISEMDQEINVGLPLNMPYCDVRMQR